MMDNKYSIETQKMMATIISDIAAERERQKMSQSELAEKAGIKQSALSRMESMKALPQLDTLCRILEPLGLKLTVKQKSIIKENSMLISNENVKKIKVDVISCNLSVTQSNDGDFHVVTDHADDFIFDTENDVFVVTQKKRTGLKWLFNWIPIDLKITVPAGFSGEVNIDNRNGRTSIYSINLDAVNIKSRNGALTLEDCNAGDLFLNNGNGKISLCGAGFKSLDAHSANGRIQLSDIKSEGAVKAKTSNGRIIAKGCKAESYDFKTSNGAVLIAGCEGGDMSFSTSNGKVVASIPGNEADYSLDFSTSVGSIYLGEKKYQGRYVIKNQGTKLEAHTSNGSIRFRFADTPDPAEEYNELFQEIEEAFAAQVVDELDSGL